MAQLQNDNQMHAQSETAWRKAVLDKLDELIGLLRPTGTFPPHSQASSYPCPLCRQWVMPNSSHYCTGYTAGRVP